MRSAGAATLLGSSELATWAGPLGLSPSLPNLPPNKSCAMCATASGRVCGLGWALGTRARRRKELCEGQWTRLGLRSSYLFSYPCSLSLLSLSPSLPLFLARSLEYVCAQDWLSPRPFPPRVCLLLGRTLSLSPSLSFSLSLSLSLCIFCVPLGPAPQDRELQGDPGPTGAAEQQQHCAGPTLFLCC